MKEAIIRLFEEGLLYKESSFINWCCDLRSTISDIEVDIVHVSGPTELKIPGYKDPVQFGYLHEFAYKVCDSGMSYGYFMEVCGCDCLLMSAFTTR